MYIYKTTCKINGKIYIEQKLKMLIGRQKRKAA